MAHQAWFMNGAVADFARSVGLSKVSKESMAREVGQGHLVMVFPEGEHGAFRPASGYKVLEFARGFVRVAKETGRPIVPVAILGGEESNPVDRTFEGYGDLLKMPIPVPKNLFPKPVKWRIRFLPPVTADQLGVASVEDKESVHAASEAVRTRIQSALDDLLEERGDPYH
jgi:1-acyl-sn-glycerol-3-phosphate acyltransferase